MKDHVNTCMHEYVRVCVCVCVCVCVSGKWIIPKIPITSAVYIVGKYCCNGQIKHEHWMCAT